MVDDGFRPGLSVRAPGAPQLAHHSPPLVLDPGTYYLQADLVSGGSDDIDVSRNEPQPAHWNQRYRFAVSTQGFTPSGLPDGTRILCDGFETGDMSTWSKLRSVPTDE